ncbi:hypothetical protein N9K77_01525 [bacterium]|nr:hypothetical protein [bacterium]
MLGAKEYENLAAIQKKKSSNYLEKSLDFKKIEMAIVEDIEISKSLVDARLFNVTIFCPHLTPNSKITP